MLKHIALTLLLALPVAAHAATPPSDDMAGARTPAGRVAVAWINKAFNELKMAEAFDLYMSRTQYRNHSGAAKDGQDFEAQKAAEIAVLVPDAHFEILQVISQGDLVAMHIRVTHKTNDRVNELTEFIRVRGGKIVDHWDMHVPVTEGSRQFTDVNRFAKP